MTVILEGGCRVSEMQEGASVDHGTLRIWNQIGRATGAQAISLRVLEFGAGLSPGIRNDGYEEILYALDSSWALPGTGRAEMDTTRLSGWADLLIDGRSHTVSPDTGIYLRPGETLAVDNPGPGSVILISSQCPDPDRTPQFSPATTSASNSIRVNQPPPLIRLIDRQPQSTADRWYRVLIDDEVGSTQVTQFVGSIPPGRAPDHFHNYEEVLFILSGEGRMWAGNMNTPIRPGSCIYLPKRQVHCVENTGAGELRLLGVFYPTGSPSVRYDV
jgi:mannose-6-phosphate isomerase-like protein (cupin superfamily)